VVTLIVQCRIFRVRPVHAYADDAHGDSYFHDPLTPSSTYSLEALLYWLTNYQNDRAPDSVGLSGPEYHDALAQVGFIYVTAFMETNLLNPYYKGHLQHLPTLIDAKVWRVHALRHHLFFFCHLMIYDPKPSQPSPLHWDLWSYLAHNASYRTFNLIITVIAMPTVFSKPPVLSTIIILLTNYFRPSK